VFLKYITAALALSAPLLIAYTSHSNKSASNSSLNIKPSSLDIEPSSLNIHHSSLQEESPVELGAVHWSRDLDKGREMAKATGKPLLILFQEVPGCSNCTQYGKSALSHPLIVEAIETCFVPVCIYNNRGGADAKALAVFNEPAWNNPVVRIVRPDGSDLVARIADFRSIWKLVHGMRTALDLGGGIAPRYLELVEEELLARESNPAVSTFSMYCFWSGEGLFGQIPGVIETESGFLNGREVVKVVYNPNVVSHAQLEKISKPKGVQACAGNDGFRADHEPKYYMAQTPYRFVPMTSLQATRVNSLIGQQQSPDALLSARQLAILKNALNKASRKKWKNAIGTKDLVQAWAEANAPQ
jgi:Thioredoxin-like/Peptide methionine sulfoxide reductase